MDSESAKFLLRGRWPARLRKKLGACTQPALRRTGDGNIRRVNGQSGEGLALVEADDITGDTGKFVGERETGTWGRSNNDAGDNKPEERRAPGRRGEREGESLRECPALAGL